MVGAVRGEFDAATAVRRLDDRTFLCEEDRETWDSMSRLVAQSLQLALLPRG